MLTRFMYVRGMDRHAKGNMQHNASKKFGAHSDSLTILSLWVLGLAVTHINESNCKLMSQEHYF